MDGSHFPKLCERSSSKGNEVRIAVYLFEEFCFLSYSAFVDFLLPFKQSDPETLLTTTWFSQDAERPQNSLGIEIDLPTQNLDALPSVDAIVLLGGRRLFTMPDARFSRWIDDHVRRDRLIYACGSGTEALAQIGVLDGRNVAVHRDELPRSRQQFPAVSFSETVFELDNNILTFATGSACIDAFANLAKQTLSKSQANKRIDRLVNHIPRVAAQPQRSTLEMLIGHENKTISMAGVAMSQNLANKQSVSEIAENIGVSQRQLERLFKAHVGISPGNCIMKVRLEAALQMLITTEQTAKKIAEKCGFLNTAHFSKQFRKEFGISPHQKSSTFERLISQGDRHLGAQKQAFAQPAEHTRHD